ncbi:MAG: hypothetical protein OCD76_14155 [Reichenbachiella sp.]
MYTGKAKNTLEQADQLYHEAQEELARPEEDVVHYMVCRNAFKSINKYLTAYVLKHGAKVHSSVSLQALLEQCRRLNYGFENINLESMYSTKLSEDVWMDKKTMQSYFSLATMTRELVNKN